MDIFENEGYFHKWRISHGAPIGYSISDIRNDDRAKEKQNKEIILEEVIDLLSNDDIRQLLRSNEQYKQINTILDKLNGMIAEELKNIKNRLKLLLKHKNPSQVSKLFRYILEY